MIFKLIGTVEDITDKSLILNVKNVCYEIFVDKKFLSEIELSFDLSIFTHYCLKENLRELYGFKTKEDREFFKFMVGIKGVGERSMMSWLSSTDTETLKHYLFSEDIDALCKLPKIGRKTGEKIITEFRHKIKLFNVSGIKPKGFNQEVIDNAISALVSLGISPSDAKLRVTENYNDGMNVSELASVALKNK